MCDQCPTRRTISLGFTDETASEGLHICYIYDDETERQEVTARFLESGLNANEKVLCLHTATRFSGPIEQLRPPRSGALTIANAIESYCPNGVFEPDQTLQLIKDFYHSAIEEGYVGARGTGQMEWALDPECATEAQLIEYEAKVNRVISQYPYTAICQYDSHQYSGRMIMDILSIHPLVIVKGQVIKNPYYIDPDIFLQSYYARPGSPYDTPQPRS